jgi:hypothetical protein
MEAHLDEIVNLLESHPDMVEDYRAFDPLIRCLMVLVAEGENSLFVSVMRIVQKGDVALDCEGLPEIADALKKRVANANHLFTEEVWVCLGDIIPWAFEVTDLMTIEPAFVRALAERTPIEAHEMMFAAVFLIEHFEWACPIGADLQRLNVRGEKHDTTAYNNLILGLLEALEKDISAGGYLAEYALHNLLKMHTHRYFPMEAFFTSGVIDTIGAFDRASTDDEIHALVKRVREHIAVFLEQQWLD